MPRRNDLLLGRVALEKRLGQALAGQAQDPRPRPLRVVVVARSPLADDPSAPLIDDRPRGGGKSRRAERSRIQEARP